MVREKRTFRIFTISLIFILLLNMGFILHGAGEENGKEIHSKVQRVLDIDPVDLELDIPERSVEYIIICPGNFKEEAAPLAVHRTEMGLYTSIYTLEDIDFYSMGRDKEEKVHYFLRQMKRSSPELRWLLILGDSEFLMPRELYHYARSRGQPFGDQYFSDVYYAGLDSNWDNDLDQVYGEVYYNGTVEADTDWDLYVGRVPASNETHAANYVNKLLRYEKNPPVGTWMKRFNNWGSLMEPPNLMTGTYSYRDHRSNAWKVCQRVNENLPEHIVLNELYDYPQLEGGNYTPGDGRDTLNRANMLAQFDQGASMLNFVGQARYYAYALNDYGPPTGNGYNWAWNEPMGYGDHEIFRNGDMMPFMYASTCDTAKFFQTNEDKDEYGQGLEDRSLETWLTSEAGGVIGLISSTNISARGEETNRSWGNWYLDEEFWKLFLNRGETRPGKALFMLKDLYQDEWYSPSMQIKETIMGMIYAYILLGEPYVDIYTDRAGRFGDDVVDELIVYEGSHHVRYQIKDRNGDPVPDARLTFFSHSTYRTMKADSQGMIDEVFDPMGDDRLNLTITAHNMIMTRKSIDVREEIQDPAILAETAAINPPQPRHGESTNITFKAANLGGQTTSSVKILVFSSMNGEDNWTILSQEGLPPIAPSSELIHGITVFPSAGTNHYDIRLQTADPEIDPKNNDLIMEIHIPEPRMTFEPGTGSIRPSNITRPGAPINIEYDIYNQGPGPGTVRLQIFLGDPVSDGVPLTDVADIGKILPDSWLNGTIPIRAPSTSGELFLLMDPLEEYGEGLADEPVVTYIRINERPRLVGTLSYTMLEDGEDGILRIDELFDDPDNRTEELSFSIEQNDNITCELITKDGNVSILILPQTNWNGEETIEVAFSDGLESYTEEMLVTVLPVNDDPVILNAANGMITVDILEDSPFLLDIEAIDIDGDRLNFSSEGAPFNIDRDNGMISWTPSQEHVGINDWTVTVEDGNGGLDSIRLQINVIEVNEAPVIQPLVDVFVEKNGEESILIEYTDEEGDPINITSSHTFAKVRGNRIDIEWDGERTGTHTVTLEITDGVNVVYAVFNVTLEETGSGDGSEKESFLDDGAFPLLIILAVVLMVLFTTFFMFRGSRTDSKVKSEIEDADLMYEEDMDDLEA